LTTADGPSLELSVLAQSPADNVVPVAADNFASSKRPFALAFAPEPALIEKYKREATLVLTPLHHVATPCLASGVPIVIARSRPDERFSFMETIVPIYTPERFSEIDWNPKPLDLWAIRSELLRVTQEKLATATSMFYKKASSR
jgi:hypothetical protein